MNKSKGKDRRFSRNKGHSNRQSPAGRAKRSTVFMLAQQLSKQYWLPYWENKKCPDSAIVKDSKNYQHGSKYASKKSQYHYLYVCYQNYYFGVQNNYHVAFDDYSKLFSRSVSYQIRAYLILIHLVMRLQYFYFKSKSKSKNFGKGEFGQTNVQPPIIVSILHDKDKSKTGRGLVAPHIHMLFKFPKRVSIKRLAKWIGIRKSQIQCGNNKDRFSFSNLCGYLTHVNVDPNENKHIYDYHRVWSNEPVFDYQTYYKQHVKGWTNHRLAQGFGDSESKDNYKALRYKMVHHMVTYEQVLMNPKLLETYITGMPMPELLQVSSDSINYQRTQKHVNGESYKSTIYISGNSRVGKSFMGKRIIANLERAKKLPISTIYDTTSCFRPSPGDKPLDAYGHQDIMFLDEARNTSLDYQTLLTLLDQDNNTFGARYHNKRWVSPDLVLFTSVQPFYEFAGFAKAQAHNEPIDQVIARIGRVAHVYSTDGNPWHSVVRIYRPGYVNTTQQIQIGTQLVASSDPDISEDVAPVYRQSHYVLYPKPSNISHLDELYSNGYTVKYGLRNLRPPMPMKIAIAKLSNYAIRCNTDKRYIARQLKNDGVVNLSDSKYNQSGTISSK